MSKTKKILKISLENGDRNFYEEFVCKIQRIDVGKIE